MGRPKKPKIKICGIYMIENIVNNKVYIGQSVDFNTRVWAHRYKLKHNKHDNEFLQADYNEYGVNKFRYSVVEECPEAELDDRERYWMDYYKSQGLSYNILKGGTKNFGDDENNPNAKAVVCIETNVVYKTIKEASAETGICASSISKVVRGLREKAGNFHWKYVNPESLKKHNSENMKCSAERKLNISNGVKSSGKNKDGYWKGKHLSKASRQKISESRKGKKFPNQQGINSYQSQQVKCVETNQVYESIRAAERLTGIHGIGKVLNNSYYKAGGYHWERILKEEYLNEMASNS